MKKSAGIISTISFQLEFRFLSRCTGVSVKSINGPLLEVHKTLSMRMAMKKNASLSSVLPGLRVQQLCAEQLGDFVSRTMLFKKRILARNSALQSDLDTKLGPVNFSNKEMVTRDFFLWRQKRCPKYLNAVTMLNGIQKLGGFAGSLSRKLFLIYGSKAMCTTLRETNLNTSSKVTRPTMWRSTRGNH